MSGVLDNLNQADMFGNSAYFQPGRYVVDIDSIIFKEGGHKGTSFIIKCSIVGVDSSHDEAPEVGGTAAQVIKLSGTEEKITMGRSNLMAFMTTTFEVDQKAYTSEQWKQVVADVCDNNSLKGKRLALDCHLIMTRADKPFTVHTWKGPPTPKFLAACGVGEVGAAAPMRGKDPDGRDIVSHDGGDSWVYA